MNPAIRTQAARHANFADRQLHEGIRGRSAGLPPRRLPDPARPATHPARWIAAPGSEQTSHTIRWHKASANAASGWTAAK